MIYKLLTLPFLIISNLIGFVFGSLKLLATFVIGIVMFVFDHITGIIFGALVGLLLGREHVGVRLFTHKRRRHA